LGKKTALRWPGGRSAREGGVCGPEGTGGEEARKKREEKGSGWGTDQSFISKGGERDGD